MTPVPNRAHFFVRFVLYNAVKQQMSTLHVIDLAGSQSFSHHQGACSSLKHQEKLAINQQLLSLSKLISEVSRLSTSQGQLLLYVFKCRLAPNSLPAAKDRQSPSQQCMHRHLLAHISSICSKLTQPSSQYYRNNSTIA